MFGKTEANEGCAHAVAGKHGRSNLFFFECLQGLANAEYFAIRNLRKPDRAVAKENRGVSGRKEMFDVFVSCGSKGSSWKIGRRKEACSECSYCAVARENRGERGRKENVLNVRIVR